MRILLLIILLSLSTVSVIAQDSWPVVERCLGDLTYPMVQQGDWDFAGIIVSSITPDGIHALRGDINAEYYLAFESDYSFASAGAISPDGQYFAYPIGHTDRSVNVIGDNVLGVDYLRVVRTDGNTDETYRFEVNNYAYVTPGSIFGLPQTTWFGADSVYYPDRDTRDAVLFQFRTGETPEWPLSISPDELIDVSPDGTRAFYIPDKTLYNLENDIPLDYPTAPHVWFGDSSAFVVADEIGLAIVDRNGNVLETIPFPNVTTIGIAPNGTLLALWDAEENLFLVDRQQQTIYDLCFQGKAGDFRLYGNDNLGWSPDSRSLAFSYDDYLVILDAQTWENQVIDHYSRGVMDWVPLSGEAAD